MEKEDLIVRLLCLANEKTCHVEVDAGKAVVKGIFVFDIPSRAPRLAEGSCRGERESGGRAVAEDTLAAVALCVRCQSTRYILHGNETLLSYIVINFLL